MKTTKIWDHFGRPEGATSIALAATVAILTIAGSVWPSRARSVWPSFDTLRGEVVQAFHKRGVRGLKLRDKSGDLVLVEVAGKGQLPSRGRMVAVSGKLVARCTGLQPELVWEGKRAKDIGEAKRFRERREYIEKAIGQARAPLGACVVIPKPSGW